MKEGLSKSLSIIGTLLFVVALGYAYNHSLSYKMKEAHSISFEIIFGLGLFTSSLFLFTSHFSKIHKYWNYIVTIGVSYLLAYFMISSGLNLYKGLIYPFSLGDLESTVKELSPSELFNVALSHSSEYKKILGYAMIGSSALICFRNTR